MCCSPGDKYEMLNEKQGILVYTDNIGPIQMKEFAYFINIPGFLPLEVCNMPTAIKLNQYQNREINFSGKMTILPEEVDAFSTRLELTKVRL
jgi:hypothetical protein